MKILVLGANGRTGRELIRIGLERGHEITALVRVLDNTDLPDGVRVVTGSALDPAVLDGAARRQDAVINAMGPRFREDPDALTRALERIVMAMRQHRAERYVGVSRDDITFPGDDREYVGSIRDRFARLRGRRDFAAKASQADLLRRSGLQWSLARARRLTTGKASGRYVLSLETPAGSWLDRADLALFLLEEAESGAHAGRAPFVATERRSK